MTLSLGKVPIEPIGDGLVSNSPVVTDPGYLQNDDAVVVVDSARVQKDAYDGRWGKLCLDDPEAVKRRAPIQSGA